MPGSFLDDSERERFRGFPSEIPPEALIGYFTLSERDLLLVRGQRRAHNRLGFALQVCALRHLGFAPARLLVPDASRGGTALTWLRRSAVSNAPKAILRNLTRVPVLRPPGQDPAEAGRGTGAPGGVSEPADQLRDRVEHGLHGGGDRATPHRRAPGPGI